jgi:hypothetical protein
MRKSGPLIFRTRQYFQARVLVLSVLAVKMPPDPGPVDFHDPIAVQAELVEVRQDHVGEGVQVTLQAARLVSSLVQVAALAPWLRYSRR